MSRLPVSRWNQILVWTGAALTWGTALVAVKSSASEAAAPATAENTVSSASSVGMPSAPNRGLVVLRFTPAERPEPDVRRVYIQASPPADASPVASATVNPPSPSSSGS